MILSNRIIWSDNGVLKDLSIQLNEFHTGSVVFPFSASQDYLFIGSDLQFNHRHFEMSVVNALPSVPTVHYWNGTAWKQAVDVIDQTSLSGATLGQSGILSFSTNKTDNWLIDDTKDGNQEITGLATLTIYDLYWMRLSFSADFTLTSAIKYIGWKFCSDLDIKAQYPDLVRQDVYDQFEVGKANWTEQIIACSETIVRDLQTRGQIQSGSQILEWDLFTESCVHRTAELIFTAFGKDYVTNRDQARKYYEDSMKLALMNIDVNGNARLDPVDRKTKMGFTNR